MRKLEKLIDQGTGREPADIVLKGGRFFDLVTGELVASDIAISDDRIVGTRHHMKRRHDHSSLPVGTVTTVTHRRQSHRQHEPSRLALTRY